MLTTVNEYQQIVIFLWGAIGNNFFWYSKRTNKNECGRSGDRSIHARCCGRQSISVRGGVGTISNLLSEARKRSVWHSVINPTLRGSCSDRHVFTRRLTRGRPDCNLCDFRMNKRMINIFVAQKMGRKISGRISGRSSPMNMRKMMWKIDRLVLPSILPLKLALSLPHNSPEDWAKDLAEELAEDQVQWTWARCCGRLIVLIFRLFFRKQDSILNELAVIESILHEIVFM